MIPPRAGRPGAVAVVFLCLLAGGGGSVLSGCGAAGPGGAADAPSTDEARDLVRTALDAWKGGAAAGLARRQPPLRFVEPELPVGSTLVGYSIREGEEKASGPVVDVAVELTIKDRKGKSRTMTTFYQVATQPQAAVLRNDPD